MAAIARNLGNLIPAAHICRQRSPYPRRGVMLATGRSTSCPRWQAERPLSCCLSTASRRVDAEMSEPGQVAATARGAGAHLTSASLFIVERRLPKIDERQLA